jgi:hypothetical protein
VRKPPNGTGRSPVLVAVVACVFVEVLLLLAVAVFFGVEMLVADASDLVTAAAVGLLALLVAAFLALCGRGLWHRRRWARAPVITWQLLTLFAVLPSLGRELWWISAFLLVLCLVAGVGLVLPTVVAETTDRTEPPVG